MMITEAEQKITAPGENTSTRRRRRPHRYIGGNLGPRKVITAKRTKPKDSAIGSLKKQKSVSDIEKHDVDNILAAVEYVEDLYRFYKFAENSSQICDYIDQQKEIDVKMRMSLVDWLIGIQHNILKLPSEILFLTVSIVDRYLELIPVARKDLVLLGLSAMLIASKFEEDSPPGVEEFVVVACGVYSKEQILSMEKSILQELGWTLAVPNTYHFLLRFVKAAGANKEVEETAFFMAELGLMQYTMIKYSPSMVAASAVYTAKRYLNVTPLWNETLELHTGYSESEVIECADQLASFHSEAVEHSPVAYRKYMSRALTL